MGTPREVIVTLIGDAAARARVASLLREFAGAPGVCLTPAEVRARLRAGGVRGLIVGWDDRGGWSAAPLVAEVRREFPDVSVVAYAEAGRTPSAAVVELLAAGAHQLWQHPYDDSRLGVQALLRAADRTNAASLVYEAIAGHVPPVARPLVNLYLRGVEGPVPVTEAALQLGVHRKTLRNRMDAAGLPAPTDLRAWCRLFLAARLLDEPGRTVEAVALQLEFNSGSALRNLMRRRAGLAPWELRASGGLAFLVSRFGAECEARRRAYEESGGAGAAPGQGAGVPPAALSRVAEPAPRVRRRAPPDPSDGRGSGGLSAGAGFASSRAAWC
jgi:AraC-like DNA-binding protein